MSPSIKRQVAALERMTAGELKKRYAEVFGEQTRTRNRAWLQKRVAWRIQCLAEGDLSERARRRAAELAHDANLRLSPPKLRQPRRVAVGPAHAAQDDAVTLDRLPAPGTVMTRKYKGRTLQVKVLAKGFEFEGVVYKTLSAVAKKVTGQHCNGYYFFRLLKKGGDR